MSASAQIVITVSTVPMSQSHIKSIDELNSKLRETALLLSGVEPLALARIDGEIRWSIRAGYIAEGASPHEVAGIISDVTGAPVGSVNTVVTGTFETPAKWSAA